MEVKFRIWIEKDGKHVIGRGGAKILKAIKEEGSISAASKKLGMSYKYVWAYVKKMENVVGQVVKSTKGGRSGGKSELTEIGEEILELYEYYENLVNTLISGKYVEGIVKEGKIIPEGEVNGERVIILPIPK